MNTSTIASNRQEIPNSTFSARRLDVGAAVRERIDRLTRSGTPTARPTAGHDGLQDSCVEVVDARIHQAQESGRSDRMSRVAGPRSGQLARIRELVASRMHFDQRTRGMLAVIMLAVAVVAAAVAWFAWPRPETVPAALPVAEMDNQKEAAEEPLKVSVVGDVMEPGLVEVSTGARVADAVEAAGGLEPEAESAGYLNLAREISDGELIVVEAEDDSADTSDDAKDTDAKDEPAADDSPSDEPSASDDASSGDSGADTSDSTGPVNINKATAQELETLTGIGPVTAEKIVEYREQNGGFDTAEELTKVDGIGPATFKKLSSEVTV